MSNLAIDSSVVAKWILPEPDSPKAHTLLSNAASTGGQLIVLDLVFPEVANAIWKRHRQKLLTLPEAHQLLALLARLPVQVEPAAPLLAPAFEIATKYDRAIYDALFVALTQRLGLDGITADEPLFNTTHVAFPFIRLPRNTC